MTRTIVISAYSYPTAADLKERADHRIITSSRLAARALETPHQPLSQLAARHLQAAGWSVATPLKAQAVFRQVVQARCQPADLVGTTNAWLPTVRSLLQSCADLSFPGSLSERTHQLLQVAQAFRQALHDEQLIDGSELYWQASHCSPAPQKLLIYGYCQPRWDELAWINAIAAPHSTLFLPVADSPLFQAVQASIEWLVQRGWQVVAAPATVGTTGERLSQRLIGQGQADIAPDAVRVYGYSTFEAEVRGTLAQVKAQLNAGTPARDMAIIARNEEDYGPQLMDVAWEYGVPLRALYDTPLLSTRLGAWLQQLVEVMDADWPFAATVKLLSHPLCSHPDGGFWAMVRVEHPVGFSQWQGIAQDHLGLDLTPLSHLQRRRKPETWVGWWYDLFKRFDLRKRCARWSRESLAFNTLYRGLVELAKSDDHPLHWSDFRPMFCDLLQTLSVPAQPGRGGVELHRPTSVVGARYRQVFVLGMAEGVFPPTIGSDPVLDFFERQQLQRHGVALPTAAELARREALSFYGLLQTVTDQITFSYPQLNQRQEQLPSPYLQQLGLRAIAPPSPPIASREELRRVSVRHEQPPDDEVLPHAIHAFSVEQHRESRDAPNQYDGRVGLPFDYADWTFSASQLRNLGQCPFKWFADKLLKLGPPMEVDDDLSPSQIGQLYHRVLELMLAEKQHHPERDISDAGLLAEKFAIAEAAILPPNLPAWPLRRSEHLRCLALTLAEPDFLPPGAEPLQLEARFRGEWHGLNVQGQVDRIDRTEAGLVLIDYKTGKHRPAGIKDRNGKACLDVQLPLYQEAAAAALFPNQSVAAAYYYSIRGRQKILPSTRAPQSELPDAIERCKAHLETGHYPVQPDAQRLACQYCDFDALCRQGERLSRKPAETGMPPPSA